MKTAGPTATQKQAPMDLLVLSRYADHNLASAQDASVPPRLEPVAVGSACHYPQVRIGVGPNPEGIAPSTPGLRACELPWEIVQTASQPQRGCGRARHPRTQPRWGWLVLTPRPSVARSSQPWALLRNPFGIHPARGIVRHDQESKAGQVKPRAIDKVGEGARHLCRFSVRSSSDLPFI